MSASTDWFAVAAYDHDKTAPAPASGFADTLPMPTAPFASSLVDDGDDDGGEWLSMPPRNLADLAGGLLKVAVAVTGVVCAIHLAARVLSGG